MTNKEAIWCLEQEGCCIDCGCSGYPNCEVKECNTYKALDLAIKALEEQPTGEWIMNKTSARGRNYTCTHCKKISRNKFAYCPNCGAKMKGDEE